MVKVLFFFAFFYLFRAVQYKFSSRHKQESLLQKAGDIGAGTAKVASLGHCFCLGFLNILFSRCPTAASEKTILFYLFACSLDYLCRGVESHFQAFLIAGDCHFQCAGSRVYRAFPERFSRILGDQLSVCKTSDCSLWIYPQPPSVASGACQGISARLPAPSLLPQLPLGGGTGWAGTAAPLPGGGTGQ